MKLHTVLALVVAFVLGCTIAEEKKEKDKDIGTVIGIDLGTTYSW
jgi:endoplasmic reticulum chaperone BiP